MAKETSSFVRKLAHNDPATRKAAFGALKSYLQSSSGEKLDLVEFEKLWKGLYFSMWYCDKPVPQQGLAGDLGKLFSEVVPQKQLKTFHQAFWLILSREWRSIDKWRLDKYLMLVRRAVRHMLFRLDAHGWPEGETREFLAVLQEHPLCDNAKFPQALSYHVCDLFLSEIEYVALKEFRDYSEEVDVDDESEPEASDDDSDDDSDDEDAKEQREEDFEYHAEEKEEVFSESEDEDDDKRQAKRAVIAKVPMDQLLAPFKQLAESARNTALKEKCAEEVMGDARLVAWGVTEHAADSDDDEWTGF